MSEYCATCGGELTWVHDHRADNSGLDDGPFLPRCGPRKRPAEKSPEEWKRIRSLAWVTRHNKVAAKLDQFLTEIIPQLYCGECDRYERDPIFLDVERCSKCGESIETSDNDDGQPDEATEWRDYDPDC